MLSIQDALSLMNQKVQSLGECEVPTINSLGFILSREIRSNSDQILPKFDQSAMDGFAICIDDFISSEVQASEVQASEVQAFEVQGIIQAGATDVPTLEKGKGLRIFTGAPMPKRANAVLIQENTKIQSDHHRVIILELPTIGANIRTKGSDVEAKQLLLSKGRQISPADIGLLLALGIRSVFCYQKPRIAVLSTGNELVEPFEPLAFGQIYNTNPIVLANQLSQIGLSIETTLCAKDDEAEILEKLHHLISQGFDWIFTIAGISVGTFDLTGHAIRSMINQEMDIYKVAIQPGKPLCFTAFQPKDQEMKTIYLMSLPGNPISALVVFELFARPMLLKQIGHTAIYRNFQWVDCDQDLPATKQRALFLRAKLIRKENGRLLIDIQRNQSSGALSSLGGADALVYLPANTPASFASQGLRKVAIIQLDHDSEWNRCIDFQVL
jgi:molybdopterin molybdotransferase